MISTEDALKIIIKNSVKFQKKNTPLSQSQGHVLTENVYADRDFPPFERVTMDGIAINSRSWEEGIRSFRIIHLQAAGSTQTTLPDGQKAVEVMTGAVLPENADVVIRYEDTTISEIDGKRMASVHLDSVTKFQNVHRKGEDRRKGDLLIPKGVLISGPEIGVLSSIGKTQVSVFEYPNVAIISTGDELVGIDQVPELHQIRSSNVFTLQSELISLGIGSEIFHLIDSKEEIRESLIDIMEKFPVIILSGGVSKGKFDFIPEVLQSLGVKQLFHKVKQRPGKPFWFGNSDKNTVFALPGNPVSTYMCFYKYVRSWFEACLGISPEKPYAQLVEDFRFTPDLTCFLQVKIMMTKTGILEATPMEGHGSGDFANLLFSDGFLELPAGFDFFKKGNKYPLLPFRGGWALS